MLDEPGTTAAREVWSSAERRTSSLLLYAETQAGLARAARTARLARASAEAARQLANGLWAEIARIDVSEAVVHRAGALAGKHALRAYDAVHLASYEEVADEDSVLVAADGALLAAARHRGLRTAPLGP